MKREDYISWDEFFMGVAKLASKRSKDPNTRHGCCIVKDNKIVSVGYNGLPKGLSDDGNYWEKPQKYEYSVHAEENALFNATVDLTGSILYLYSDKGYYPCSRCARGILQNDIYEVVLDTEIQEDTEKYTWNYTKHMFEQANVKVRILNAVH